MGRAANRIQVINATPCKNKNWVKLYVYAPYYDNNRKYTIDYCGTDCETALPLTTFQTQRLIEHLQMNFGFAPFDVELIKDEIQNGINFDVNDTI